MDHSFEPQPRDSRLEKFSAAASNIISVERGLTATAMRKIHMIAMEQHLSEDQVTECLDRIGDGGSSVGRVGRYEQIFIERLDTEFSKTTGTVLRPQNAQEAIRLATVEYQISAPRAQQLLDHVATKHGLRQISNADARKRLRVLIAQRLESSRRREDFEDELVTDGANFGISASEVRALLDTEIETRNQWRSRRNGRLLAGTGSILIAVGLAVAGSQFWPNTQTPVALGPTAAEPVAGLDNTVIINAPKAPSAHPLAGSQNSVKQTTKNLSTSDTGISEFKIEDFVLMPNTASVLKFEKWQEQFVKLVGRDFQQSSPDTKTSSFADRQKKKDALDTLESESSNERIQTRALNDLSAIAKRIVDISPKEANSIATFCLGKHSTSTEAAILRAVKQFGRWPNLLLAVSDAFANQDLQSSTDQWHQRIAFAITDGKLKRNDDFSKSFFTLARLRTQEILNQQERNEADSKVNVEAHFIQQLRQFISGSINNQHHQRYFNRLIDARDLARPSMQRQIELQQILIEALLFAKPDDVSLTVGETHFNRLNSATTLGQQLALSRQSAVELVARHCQWLKQTATRPTLEPLSVRRNVILARHLRDEAEDAAMSGDSVQIPNAVAKYEAAIDCGDTPTIRSCLRGLIAIARNQSDQNSYHRRLDFANGVQRGPLWKFAGNVGDSNLGDRNSAPSNWQTIVIKCRQLRRPRSSQTRHEEPATANLATGTPSIIGAALGWLATRRLPLSTFELDLLLRIEARATLMQGSGKVSHSPIELPNDLQATLPAVEVTPLVPQNR